MRIGRKRMLRSWSIAAVALTCGSAIQPTYACRMHAPIVLDDVKYAEVVFVGRVLNYTIVRDQALRERMLSNPHLSPQDREFYTGDHDLMGDYARIEMQVDETLVGIAPKKLTLTWYNSTFGLPKTLTAGPFLVALRKPSSSLPPLRGPSATIVPNHEPDALTLLQAPCSSPFMFESMSNEAQSVRRMLGTRPG